MTHLKKLPKMLSVVLVSALFFGQSMVAHVDQSMALMSSSQDKQEYPVVSINTIREEVVAEHKTSIAKSMYWNKVARYGVKGAAVVGGVLVGYQVLKSLGLVGATPQVPAVAATAVVVPAASEVVTSAATFDAEKLTQRLAQLEENVSPKLLSYKWFKHMGFLLGEHLVLGIAAGSLYAAAEGYVKESVFHPGSIGWFVHTNTKLMSTLDELKQYAAVIDADDCKERRAYFIVSGCNSIVRNMEVVLGFLEYKQEFLKGTQAADGIKVNRYVYNITNEFCQKVSTLLADDSLDGQKRKAQMESALNFFKSEVGRLLISFSRIEAE